MTQEKLAKIREAVETLSELSSNDWNEISKFIGKPIITEKNNEKRVYELLRELGVPSGIIGFNYIKRAVMLCLENPTIFKNACKNLYPTIAKEFNTTYSRAERAIRHAIEVAWDRANQETIHDIFGYSFSPETGRTTNTEFIAGIVDYIQI